MNIPQAGQFDGVFMDEALQEVSGLVEEQVTIKRFASITPGDSAAGQGDVVNYDSFSTLALCEALSAQEINMPNSIYATGDLRAQFKIEVFGGEGAAGGDAQAANRRSDLVTYRGRTYRIIGHVEREHYGGIYYWSAVMRQGVSS